MIRLRTDRRAERALLAMGVLLACLGCGPKSADNPNSFFQPLDSPTPTTISVLKPDPTAARFFSKPEEPGYVSGQGFNPDAARIVAIAALQVSIERYYASRGQFPEMLELIFPEFAPKDEEGKAYSSTPVDPVTKLPYTYSRTDDGHNYRISAKLNNGAEYAVQHRVR